MSIEALVNRFGMTLYLYRPTVGIGTDGQATRSYVRSLEVRGFLQPGSQSSDVFQARMNGRTPATIYLSGSVDVRIDDEIRDGYTGTVRNWRVTGASQPGETSAANSAANLTMTVVDAIEVEPGVTL